MIYGTIYNPNEIIELLAGNTQVSFYGAGKKLKQIIDFMLNKNISLSVIKCIYVTKKNDENDTIHGINIIEFEEKKVDDSDIIILAMSVKFIADIDFKKLIEFSKAKFYVSFLYGYALEDHTNIYNEILESIKPFIVSYKNTDVVACVENNPTYRLWSCWWQGVDSAPEVVKACLASQKLNCPPEVEYVLITSENYSDYLDMPEYILEKVRINKITLTTVSDIIRSYLIFNYGGIWIDATVLLEKPIPLESFKYSFFTCKGAEFGRELPSLWLIGGKKNNPIFDFIYHSFLYYYRKNDSLIDYFTVLYFLNIAFDQFPEFNIMYDELPENNMFSGLLSQFAEFRYDYRLYRMCFDNTCVQKLSYKIDYKLTGNDSLPNMYEKIVRKYL